MVVECSSVRQTRVVDVTADLDARCPPADLTGVLRDLDRYPEWLSILPRTEVEEGSTPAAWSVELRATIGPLARSKRLRMVRVVDEPDHVRFERVETDGRRHSPWVLDAAVAPTADGSHLTMSLHYGGAFGGGIVERLLRDEIESSRQRLRDLVERGPDRP
jgi:hypothetical protein